MKVRPSGKGMKKESARGNHLPAPISFCPVVKRRLLSLSVSSVLLLAAYHGYAYQNECCNHNHCHDLDVEVVSLHAGPHLEQLFGAVSRVMHHRAAGDDARVRILDAVYLDTVGSLAEEVAYIDIFV